jgi:hypothetical protein
MLMEEMMATTRELVIRSLENNDKLRNFFEEKHSFDLEKARNVDLKDYNDYVSVILKEGVETGAVDPSELEEYKD